MVRTVVLGAALAGLVVACGGGGQPDQIQFSPDAAGRGPDAAPGLNCDAVSGLGCPDGQKCAAIVDSFSPFESHVGCTPVTNPDRLGQPCTEAQEVGQADSCENGTECYEDTCHKICNPSASSTCPESFSCLTFIDPEGDPLDTAICLPSCNLFTQDCPQGQGCYLTAGGPICVGISEFNGLNEPCSGCINCCNPGLACVGPSGGRRCRAYCSDWPQCYSEADGVIGCGCPGCGPDGMCLPIVNAEGVPFDPSFGVCLPDAEFGCNCQNPSICG